MDEALNTLCSVLDDELERQEMVLAVCKAQQEAIQQRNMEHLQDKTAALEILIREAKEAEAERMCVLRQIVGNLELPPERQTMSELIGLAPEPWCSRLRDFQKRIRETVSETQALVRGNRRVLRQSLRVVDQCVNALQHCSEANASDYTASGAENRTQRGAPALLDQKG
ncbi:MAG: flagellar protein FlgN [bacterium]|nr:flagellar protein FlgN [bacterium]